MRSSTSRSLGLGGQPIARVLPLFLVSALALSACGDTTTLTCSLNIGHQYEEDESDLELSLDHNCDTGVVSGTLYSGDFPFDLVGRVDGDRFSFEAIRELPSGGTASYRTHSDLEIVSGGVIIRGSLSSGGGIGAVVFRADIP